MIIVDDDPPKSNGAAAGLARRDATHRRQEEEHARIIHDARRMMAIWLEQFDSITADDVQDLCILPPDADPRVMGAVPKLFAARGWIRADGYERSKRPQAHARPVTRWVLVDRPAVVAWRENNPQQPEPAGVAK